MNLALHEYQDQFARLLLADLAEAMNTPEAAHLHEAAHRRDAARMPDLPAAAPALHPALHPTLAALARQPGFAVYRNTVLKGCVDALAANFPTVCRLVGQEWFRAAAALYARAHPPAHPALIFYGAGPAMRFADFLAAFEPAAELPYLPGVARLDQLWTQAHAAPDSPAASSADLARLAQLPPEALMESQLPPHPAARWQWFDDMPIHTIWQRNRAPLEAANADGNAGSNAGAQAAANDEAEIANEEAEIEWQAEGTLLTRPQGAVQWRAASGAECAFLDACAAGHTVAQAAQAALARDPQAGLAGLIGGLIAAGAFAPPAC
jgi:hypothetical protein